MFKEFDCVKLKNGNPKYNITPQDIGAIVDIQQDAQGKKHYMVEFDVANKDLWAEALTHYYSEEELVKAN